MFVDLELFFFCSFIYSNIQNNHIKVQITLSTHTADGITKMDVDFASFAEKSLHNS